MHCQNFVKELRSREGSVLSHGAKFLKISPKVKEGRNIGEIIQKKGKEGKYWGKFSKYCLEGPSK